MSMSIVDRAKIDDARGFYVDWSGVAIKVQDELDAANATIVQLERHNADLKDIIRLANDRIAGFADQLTAYAQAIKGGGK